MREKIVLQIKEFFLHVLRVTTKRIHAHSFLFLRAIFSGLINLFNLKKLLKIILIMSNTKFSLRKEGSKTLINFLDNRY